MKQLFCLSILASPVFAAAYSTYIGDAFPYKVAAVTTDAGGSTYVTGGRQVRVSAAKQPVYDVFVTKLDASGKIVFRTSIAGNGSDRAAAIALDRAGGIYIGGVSLSTDFPLTRPLQSRRHANGTGFLIKLSADDGTVLYSTYFGGTQGSSAVNAVATDGKGNVVLTGSTYASDFPNTPGMPASRVASTGTPVSGAYVASISSGGDKILYAGLIAGSEVSCGGGSTCFLSERRTSGVGIAVDEAGNAYVAGNTNTTDLAATPRALLTRGIGAFVARVNAGGAGLGYLTYLGAANHVLTPFSNAGNRLNAIATDAEGNAYLAGATSDPGFPATPGTFQPVFGGGRTISPLDGPPTDAFLAKLKPDGSGMVWATFLGGDQSEAARAVAVDGKSGSVWMLAAGEGGDFLTRMVSNGSAVTYSARYPAGSALRSLTLNDPTGFVHIAGEGGIVSVFTPELAASMSVSGIANAAGSLLSGRIAPGEIVSIHGARIGPVRSTPGSFDSSGFLPKSLAETSVSIGGKPAPLLYVSETRISAIVPMDIGSGSADCVITFADKVSPAFRTNVTAALPEVFTNSDGGAAALNEDGSINSRENPAKPGSVISIWATGTGSSFAPLTDGQAATAAFDTCTSCRIELNGQDASILYAGTSPGMVAGLTQINVRLPSPSLANAASLVLSVGNERSSVAFVYVAP